MLLAGPISNTGIQYLNFIEIFNFHWICAITYFVHLVGVELPLCIVVTLFQNTVTCFLESS